MITVANINDLNVLDDLNKEVQNMHHDFSPKRFKKHNVADMSNLFKHFIEDKNSKVLIKSIENKAIGYLIYEIIHKEESYFRNTHSYIYVHHIAIEENQKGKGFAFDLFQKVFKKGKELNIDSIELDVWTQNKIAKKYFKKLGFNTYNEKMELNI